MSDGSYLSIEMNSNRWLDLYSDVFGSGTMKIVCNASNAAHNKLFIGVHGDCSGFYGKTQIFNENSKTVLPLEENLNYFTVSVGRGESLGGAMTGFWYNGIEIRDYNRIVPLKSMALEAKNRGIFVNGTAYFVCSNDVELAIKNRITYNGAVKKTGVGTLALGGEEPLFYNGSATTSTVVAESNNLVIAEGALKVLSSAAFRGLKVTFGAGMKLALVSEGDATLGMDLTKDGSDLVITDSKLAVEVLPNAKGKYKMTAICTVPSTSTLTVDSFAAPTGGEIIAVNNGDGTITFKAVPPKAGFFINFR